MEDAVLAEFLCPICANYISQPIRQCVQGHLFCYKCFSNTDRCAICREKKSDDRCIPLEEMHTMLRFPCRYRDHGDGCEYTGKPSELAAHETSCQPMECPMIYFGCKWKGKFLELSNHCRLEHEYCFSENKRVVITDRCQVNQADQIIISCFNTLFRCSWYIDSTSNLKVSVYHIGNPSITDRFFFEFGIKTKHGDKISKFPCYQAYQMSQFLLNDKYMLVVRDIKGNAVLLETIINLKFWVEIHKMDSKNVETDNPNEM